MVPRTVLALTLASGLALTALLSCGGVDEPLAAGAAQLSSLAEQGRAHEARLEERLRARDELGPGEFRDRLRALHADVASAQALEVEARAAALLAQLAEAVEAGGERGRRLLAPHLPPALVPALALPPVGLARAALEHAARAASGAVALRTRAAEGAPALAELRERLVDTRRRLARARLVVAEALAALGPATTVHAADLVPFARRHGVGVREVQPLHTIGDVRTVRSTVALQLEAPESRPIADLVRELADRAGTRLDSLRLRRSNGRCLATLGLTLRGPRPGTEPLRAREPTSTLADVERALADASAWRETLTAALVPEPGPAVVLSALSLALPKGAHLQRLHAEEGRFEATVSARGPAQQAVLAGLRPERRLTLWPAVSQGRQLLLRGRYGQRPAPLSASALEAEPAAPRPPSRGGSRPRPLVVGNAVDPAGPATPSGTAEPGWRLVGVASAHQGEVRALLRDAAGRPHIVAVGGRLEDGAKVLTIARDHVSVRRGGTVHHIRAAD